MTVSVYLWRVSPLAAALLLIRAPLNIYSTSLIYIHPVREFPARLLSLRAPLPRTASRLR